ncbi:SET domain [Trypanosoma melophagium]|uniref:SET domain n=1 Tax=Trypanosoma melophagium TaxID=715481 RepID=UPI00351A3433|nr:SET domain [Trypanosoma melophagium]
MLLPHEIRKSSTISSNQNTAHTSPSTEETVENGNSAPVENIEINKEKKFHTAVTIDATPLSIHNTPKVKTNPLSSSSSSCEEKEPITPSSTNTPVIGIGPTALTGLRQRPQFSFIADPHDRIPIDALSVHVVPNNTPKPLLPMWASSLTSPLLGKQRIRVENWISTDSMGTISEEHVMEFIAWLRDQLNDNGCSALFKQLEENIEFSLRRQYTRGLIARKDFHAGEVIFAIPLSDVSLNEQHKEQDKNSSTVSNSSSLLLWGLVLNSETLERYSMAAQRRGAPSYATIEAIVNKRKSSFDPVPHPLFIDQVYTAVLLACEKAEGTCSPLYPYLRLLAPFDDDLIRELHAGVLDPPTHLEYNDHCNRFMHYLRQIHTAWLESYEISCCIKENCQTSTFDKETEEKETVEKHKRTNYSPNNSMTSERLEPPCIEDLNWAFRVVLSRQHHLPVRQRTDYFDSICTEDKRMQKVEDIWTRLVSKLHWTFMDRVFGAVDHKRLHVNDFNPHIIPTILPVIDMLQHPPGGVANTAITVENLSANSVATNTVRQHDNHLKHNGMESSDGIPCAVVRALCEVETGDELTLLFSRCYSLSYTLYRFGFLPLRRRADDKAAAIHIQNAEETPHVQFTTETTPPLLRSADCTQAQER